ncbi:MAG: GNAT family N-acetyltransferase [Chlorobium phaeobacteroides]|nr:GNAT family N-acetyltransferase [Chlorobium phaeobacteroides]
MQWLPYLVLPAPEGYVSELFVAESWRGQGIGKQLLATAEEEAKTRGCSRLMLCNNRDRDSYRRGFYQKLGWEERASIANFIFRL